MLTARTLHMAGADVTLLERGQAGKAASWAGGGILSPLYPWRYPESIEQLAREGQRLYPQLAEALKAETGIDPEWAQTGLLVLDANEKTHALTWSAGHQVAVQWVEGEVLRDLEPSLTPEIEQGLWLPDVAQLRNPRLGKALRTSLYHRIRIYEQTAATQIMVHHERVMGVQTQDRMFLAQRVIVAGGAWSAALLRDIAPDIHIEPVRGQMIAYAASPGTLSRILLLQDHYLIPRRDGLVLAGSTTEYVGFDCATTATAQADIHAVATHLVPTLKRYPIHHHWAGLRPAAPGGVPYIGEHPQIQGLYINAGHFRYGILMAPASAQRVTDQLTGGVPDPSSCPYSIRAPRNDLKISKNSK